MRKMFDLKIISQNYLLIKQGQSDEGKCYGIINGAIRVYQNENEKTYSHCNDELNQ